ncbi:MAG: PAS domain-containing protein, partial [Ekhidna sp.]
MINTDEKIEKGLNPVFDEEDLQALCAYDAFLDKHHEEISANLREGLKDDPVLGPIISSQTEEERQEQEEISRRLQKAAIQEGEWEQYTNLLRAQAIGYAKAGLGFSDWVRVVMLYRDYALEFIKTKSHESIETILEIVDGQNKLIDYALNVIGSSFIDELREKYERKSQQLELALSVGKIGVWDWDMKENHIVWDETMYKLYDLKKSEFKNKYEDFEKRVHPDDREKVSNAVTRSIENREDFTSEFRVIHRDGSLHYLTGRGKIIYGDDGFPIRITGINMVITEIKQAEERLEKFNEELEKQVNVRTKELRESNKELEDF